MSFPDGEFIIRNRASQRVLDDANMSTQPGNSIIAYDYRQDADNQRWFFEDGHLYNVNSNLLLTFNDLTPESTPTQEVDNGGDGQRFEYNDGIISLANNSDLVVGAWDADVKIVTPDVFDPARRWDFSNVSL
ncbi:hypothetical protein NHJ13734_003463 [Beauveria thailandica]